MRFAAPVLIVLAALAIGCGRRQVEVVDPATDIHLSGRWNDSDSRKVASKLINQALNHPWINDFRDRAGRKPIVRVATIVNKSNEEIATRIFTDDLARELQNSGKVRFVVSRDVAELTRAERGDIQENSSKETAPQSHNETAPDFLLQGTIDVQPDNQDGKQVKFYQVDIMLVDLTTNEVIAPWSDEVKKVVEN